MKNKLDSLRPLRRRNVGDVERIVSAATGVGMITFAVMRRSLSNAGLMVAGGYLIYRGITGRCPLMQATGLRTSGSFRPDLELKFGNRERDIVEQASWESFPASDPPAW